MNGLTDRLVRRRGEPAPSDSVTPEDSSEDSPEHLPRKAWATILLFAVFVVAASGCVVGHLIR